MGINNRWYWLSVDEDGKICAWNNKPQVWAGKWECGHDLPAIDVTPEEFSRKFGERAAKPMCLYKAKFFAAIIEEV